MGVEIERKFLVKGDFRAGQPTLYCQGYLSREPGRTVRVRIAGDQAFLTVKSLQTDLVRQEFEYPIPAVDAKQMLELCDGPLVEKFRWKIPFGGLLWEVDEFLGENAGLIVAEVELDSPDQQFEIPAWVGEEVTDDHRYHNSRLSVHPFTKWNASHS